MNMSQTYLHILAKITGEHQEGHRMGKSDEETGLRLQGGKRRFPSRSNPEKASSYLNRYQPRPPIQPLALPSNLFSKWVQNKLRTPKAKQLIFPSNWLQQIFGFSIWIHCFKASLRISYWDPAFHSRDSPLKSHVGQKWGSSSWGPQF